MRPSARKIIVGLVVALGLALVGQPMPSEAQSPTGVEGCEALNVVLIIDQSDSMRINDPSNQRLEAAQAVIERLFLYSGLNCPTTTSHIAVVEFGSEAGQIFGWEPVKVTSVKDDAAFRAATGRLKGQLRPAELGQTNFSVAFAEAAKLFKNVPDPDAKNVAILVTDGLPCVIGTGGTRVCGEPYYIEYYFNGTSQDAPDSWDQEPAKNGLIAGGLIQQLARDFKVDHLSVLYFAERGDNPNGSARKFANTGWTTITQVRGGKYIDPEKLTTREKITAEMDAIINSLLAAKVETVLCDKPVYVEPYTSATAIFTAIGPKRFLNITITDPNGNTIQDGKVTPANAIDFERQNALDSVDRYVIQQPTPGTWTVKGTTPDACANLSLTYEPITIRPRVLKGQNGDTKVLVNVDPTAQYLTPSEDGYLTFEVKDSFGNPFKEISNNPLTVTGTVVAGPPTALNSLKGMEITFTETGDGKWSSSALPAPQQVTPQTKYQVTIVGKTKSVGPNKGEVQVFTLTAEYETLPPAEIRLVPAGPDSNAILPLNRVEPDGKRVILPVPVAAGIQITSDNSPQNISTVFAVKGNPNLSVIATLRGPDGQQTEAKLTPDPTDPKMLRGEFLKDVPEDERNRFGSAGQYTISFTLAPGVLAGEYNTETYKFNTTPPAPITIERKELKGLAIQIRQPSELSPLSPPLSAPAKRLINRFDDSDTLRSNPLTVEAEINDVSNSQSVKSLADSKGEIFSSRENLADAVLIGPSGTEVERIPMIFDEGAGVFRATFFTKAGDEKREDTGVFRVRVVLNNTVRDAAAYSIVQQEATSQPFERVLRTGIRTQITSPAKNQTLELNQLDKRTQKPLPIVATVRFTNATKPNETVDPAQAKIGADDAAQKVVGATLAQALRLELRDSEGKVVGKPIALTDAKPGALVGELVVSFPITTGDLSRLATGTITLVFDDTKQGKLEDPNIIHQLLGQKALPSVPFNGVEISGVTIQLVELDGTPSPDPSQSVTAVDSALYPNIPSAILVQRNPVKMAFRILDQDNNALTLAQLGITESDPAEVAAKLAALLTVEVLPPNTSVPLPLNSFSVEPRLDAPDVFVTQIGADFADEGTYALTYKVNPGQLPRNLRLIAGAESGGAAVSRTITGVLTDPNTYAGVRNVLLVLLFLFVANLVRVNRPIGGHKMRGSIQLSILNNTVALVKLQGFKVFRNISRTKANTQVNGKKAAIRLKVSPNTKPDQYDVMFKIDSEDRGIYTADWSGPHTVTENQSRSVGGKFTLKHNNK